MIIIRCWGVTARWQVRASSMDIFSCYPRKQLEETLEDWNETKQQESTLDQAKAPVPPMCRHHCSSAGKSQNLQEEFAPEVETKESADPKEAEKNWERSKRQWFLSWQESMNLSGNRRLCRGEGLCRMVFKGIQRRKFRSFCSGGHHAAACLRDAGTICGGLCGTGKSL